MIKQLLFIVFIFSFIISCTTKPKILSVQKMKVIMWDMINAEEWTKIRASKDSTILFSKQNISLYNKIFALNNITKNEFYNSYTYYQSNPNEMKQLLDSLIAYGIKKRDTVANHIVPKTTK